MFTKILIANRGEIACRVMQTARRMGVATVAVYSDADAAAKHVAMADEAVHIGPAPARESYLVAEKIIEAAKTTGAQAIHPGYGFLSENPDFVEAVEAVGLTFIGPSADAIRKMGLKDAAKRLMEQADVPVVPGYHGDEQDPSFLASEAEKIGFPVLIKASAGGGGKGMRLVEDVAKFDDALASAQREAEAAFGDKKVLVEKFITSPRHVEIQVFGDGDKAIHLFERDCSLQRRHQKVIEEAPAPGMTEEVRNAMGAAAVRAAESIGYKGAGTVEFIVDGSNGLRPDAFWFMEMNTRLQVEHPVTEEVTGVDLVEWQLRVAAGAPLPVRQEDLTINGHAFEARIYAEDAAKKFMPQTGPLEHLMFPKAGVRIDAGVRPGDRITPFYDPMIAKVTVHGADRNEALGKLRAALAATEVAGTMTNVAFLSALATHDGFSKGDVDTGLIDRDLAKLTDKPETPMAATALAALAALDLLKPRDPQSPWDNTDGWRLWGSAKQGVFLNQGADVVHAEVTTLSANRFGITVADTEGTLTVERTETGYAVDDGTHRAQASVVQHGPKVTVFTNGFAHGFTIPDVLAVAAEESSGGNSVVASMTGLIKAVQTEPGAKVSAGDVLILMEAMKMEHTLTAPRDGVVADVSAKSGDQVEEGAVLIVLEDQGG
ncbi:MAG: acetyl/propionyl/methylcrotonyl-CoA carboxylase subunit alpha [Pseudomonadota bacterium]